LVETCIHKVSNHERGQTAKQPCDGSFGEFPEFAVKPRFTLVGTEGLEDPRKLTGHIIERVENIMIHVG
jgi:hypothetical protein